MMVLKLYILYILLIYKTYSKFVIDSSSNYVPVVLWHGMGDSCCNPLSMGRIIKAIKEELPGIYVYSVKIGPNFVSDTEHGFIGNVNNQIKEICKAITVDPLLENGFNAVGFSQGSQFLRGLIERCPHAKVKNFITFGGQHQGVFGLPHCPAGGNFLSWICEILRKLLNEPARLEFLQNYFIQAQYWHDPLHENIYRKYSKFLADINNENEVTKDYRNRLLKLSKFVMIKFLKDSMVVPKESAWFGFYAPGQDSKIIHMNETKLYSEDRIGLKELNRAGKLKFLTIDDDHMHISMSWFKEHIVKPYLGE